MTDTGLERLLRRDRTVTLAALAMLTALAWIYVIAGAGLGMSAWDMTTLTLFPHRSAHVAMSGQSGMPGMNMPAPAWSLATWTLMVAMWWSMMVAMMSPSAAPAILLYARTFRHAQAQGQSAKLAPTGAFAAGYLLVWLAFAIAATLTHALLARANLLSPAMGSQSRWLSAAVLFAAGLYQLSPLKRACLNFCRAPASFLARHWRPGAVGALRLGALHGVYCVGCCWLLMTLLFVGGVMNLAWIAALTLLVLAEKLAPTGKGIGIAAGAILLLWGAATLLV